jgi:hypothetical protein
MKGVLVSLAGSKTGVSDSGPKLLALHMPCLLPSTMCQTKSCGRGQINQAYDKVSGHVRDRGRISTKTIFCNVWYKDMSIEKGLGQGSKVHIIKESQS